jgi:hypothetical protein
MDSLEVSRPGAPPPAGDSSPRRPLKQKKPKPKAAAPAAPPPDSEPGDAEPEAPGTLDVLT